MKIILHLCADIGSDSRYYQLDPEYKVILIGKEIGVENYRPPIGVHGIIANPPCTEFSTAGDFRDVKDLEKGMFLVNHCMRIIKEANPHFWVIENPAKGVLKSYLGEPTYEYEPWWYGSPWTKRTALWGKFNIPERKFWDWKYVIKIPELYTRPGRPKPSLAFMHKSHYHKIPEFQSLPVPDSDMEFRSLCSQKFAEAFFNANQ